jgi:transposase
VGDLSGTWPTFNRVWWGSKPAREHTTSVADSRPVLSPRTIRLIEELADDWRRLDDRVDAVTSEVQALARQDEGCRRLMSVPGIGALTASAVVATIGNGAAFTKGRDFGAWLGLVPKQLSTGDRTILGRLSKRGNKYMRTVDYHANLERGAALSDTTAVDLAQKHWARTF